MDEQQHMARAEKLFRRGRFKQSISKDSERFHCLDAQRTYRYKGQKLTPYMDKKTGQIVLGFYKNETFFYLAFSRFDYFFGAESDFEWSDRHTYGSDDID